LHTHKWCSNLCNDCWYSKPYYVTAKKRTGLQDAASKTCTLDLNAKLGDASPKMGRHTICVVNDLICKIDRLIDTVSCVHTCAHELRCESRFGSPNLSSYWVVSFHCDDSAIAASPSATFVNLLHVVVLFLDLQLVHLSAPS
jgi:hypothetical protein